MADKLERIPVGVNDAKEICYKDIADSCCFNQECKYNCSLFCGFSKPKEKYYFVRLSGFDEYRKGIRNFCINEHPFVWMKKQHIGNSNAKRFREYDLISWQPITREEYELWQEVNE